MVSPFLSIPLCWSTPCTLDAISCHAIKTLYACDQIAGIFRRSKTKRASQVHCKDKDACQHRALSEQEEKTTPNQQRFYEKLSHLRSPSSSVLGVNTIVGVGVLTLLRLCLFNSCSASISLDWIQSFIFGSFRTASQFKRSVSVDLISWLT